MQLQNKETSQDVYLVKDINVYLYINYNYIAWAKGNQIVVNYDINFFCKICHIFVANLATVYKVHAMWSKMRGKKDSA